MQRIGMLLMIAAVAGLVAAPGVGATAEESVDTNDLDATSSVNEVESTSVASFSLSSPGSPCPAVLMPLGNGYSAGPTPC